MRGFLSHYCSKIIKMIYIQSDKEKGNGTLPNHFDCACALYGAIETVQDFKLISYEEVASGKFDNLIRQNLFVGSVEFMREVFSRVGLEDVRLPKNSNRESITMTLGEAFEHSANGKHYFIKPLEIKLFTGLVLDGMQYSCLTDKPKDTKVLAYEIFDKDIVSEWRVYVHNGKIFDWRNYGGDFAIIPSTNYVMDIIMQNRATFPTSYTIDVGVLEDFENVVVEFNDMWAIGNYGVQNDSYLRMLRDRYFEIMRNI